MNEDKRQSLNKIVHSESFSGVVYVTKDENVIYQDCNGYSDRTNKLRNNIDTVFATASGTKLFTALGIMRLVEDGKLQLTDKVFDLIDYDYPTYDKDVTVKHLLTHTSGLPDYLDEDELEDGEVVKLSVPNYELLKPCDYLDVMPHKPMISKPGTAFKYSNSGFVFLSVIIEQLTGDYHKYIKEEILDKANMNDSGFFYMNNLPSNTAVGYKSDDLSNVTSNIFDVPIVGSGDGGMFTTVKDMKKFWSSFINGQIVSEDTVKLMTSEHSKATTISYGLGVWLVSENNKFCSILFGQDIGVSFESGYNPNTGVTHTIISNTEKGAWGVSKVLSE